MLGFLDLDPRTKPDPGFLVDASHPQAQGLRLFLALDEGAGRPFDAMRQAFGSLVGAPSWLAAPAAGTMGRGGYSTSAYDVIDPPAQILGVTYPFALAFGLVTSSSTAQQYPGGQSSTASNNPVAMIGVNQGSGGNTANSLAFFSRGDNGTDASVYATSRTECADAKYHVFAGVARSATARELWCDGKLIATASTTLGAMTAPQYALGVRRRTAVDLPFLGTIAWHQAFSGGLPDMEWLAREPYAAVLPPSASRLFLLGGAAGCTAAFAATLGDQSLSASVASAAPPGRTAGFASTLGDQALSATVAVVTASCLVSFAATLADQALSASATAAAPAGRTVAFASTLADQALSASVTTAAPAGRTASFAATLAGQSLSASVLASAAGTIAAAFAATLGDASLAAVATVAAPPSRSATFAVTLGAESLATSVTTAGPTACTAAFAAMLGDVTIVAAFGGLPLPDLAPYRGSIVVDHAGLTDIDPYRGTFA